MQLVIGEEPNISNLGIFVRDVHVLVAQPNHTKLALQRRLRIYVGFESPPSVRYLK